MEIKLEGKVLTALKKHYKKEFGLSEVPPIQGNELPLCGDDNVCVYLNMQHGYLSWWFFQEDRVLYEPFFNETHMMKELNRLNGDELCNRYKPEREAV